MNKTLLNSPGWGVAMGASYGTLLLFRGASEAGVGGAAGHITLLNNRAGSALLRVTGRVGNPGIDASFARLRGQKCASGTTLVRIFSMKLRWAFGGGV
jgi:hypothetical protein